MRIFLELQCLVDYLVDYFRIINVYQFSFTLNILFDKVDSLKVETRKKKKMLDAIYILFS